VVKTPQDNMQDIIKAHFRKPTLPIAGDNTSQRRNKPVEPANLAIRQKPGSLGPQMIFVLVVLLQVVRRSGWSQIS
jgi:hypothetical protein